MTVPWFQLFALIICCYCSSMVVESKNWAFLVATSSNPTDGEPVNYRHQSDVCHAYQVLRSRGIPADNIIVMMLDDAAHHPENPYPGKLFNVGNGPDVYAGVKIDYRQTDVNSENFRAVLSGDKSKMAGKGSGRVIESSSQDNVFVYLSGHGKPGTVIFDKPTTAFSDNPLTVKDLTETLRSMHEKGRYSKLVFYLELCYGGSMFEQLPDNWNVYALSASAANEKSTAAFCSPDPKFDRICLGDMFSLSWMADAEKKDLSKRSLQAQYETIKAMTTKSSVCLFGTKSIGNDMASEFLGSQNLNVDRSVPHSASFGNVMPVSDIPQLSAKWQREQEKNVTAKAELERQKHVMEQIRSDVELGLDGVANERNLEPTSLSNYVDCHDIAVKGLFTHCAKSLSIEHTGPLIIKIAGMCRAGTNGSVILSAISNKCPK